MPLPDPDWLREMAHARRVSAQAERDKAIQKWPVSIGKEFHLREAQRFDWEAIAFVIAAMAIEEATGKGLDTGLEELTRENKK